MPVNERPSIDLKPRSREVTDGLERDGNDDLPREMDRLHRSCRRLVWLNPLLRFDAFEAKAQGIRASSFGPQWIRFVTHLDVDDAMLARIEAALSMNN